MIHINRIVHGYAIAAAAGTNFAPEIDVVISREGNGRLLGGVIYKDFTGASIALHIGSFSPKWINRDILWVAFHYPFVQLGCRKIFGVTPETNSKALALSKHLGFKEIVRIPDVFADGGLVVQAMTASECRWLAMKPRHISDRSVNGFQEFGAEAS